MKVPDNPDQDSAAEARARILTRGDAPSIAYRRLAGRSPGVMFLPGFMSDMSGSKAQALDAYCRACGQSFVRFDYRGHGESAGAFEDADIGTWFADALDVFDRATEGPQILVGSSMGGWIMLLLARARPERVRALVGIAAAPDFTRRLEDELTNEQLERLRSDGRVAVPSAYGNDYVFTRQLIESGRIHGLLDGDIAFDGPVRLLHGRRDDAVPYDVALQIQARLTSTDVEAILIKDGDHRLSTQGDLARLMAILGELLDRPSA